MRVFDNEPFWLAPADWLDIQAVAKTKSGRQIKSRANWNTFLYREGPDAPKLTFLANESVTTIKLEWSQSELFDPSVGVIYYDVQRFSTERNEWDLQIPRPCLRLVWQERMDRG
jgi:hypothetical protein